MKYWVKFLIGTAVILGAGYLLGGKWFIASTYLATFNAGCFALDRLAGVSERLEDEREFSRITRPGAGI